MNKQFKTDHTGLSGVVAYNLKRVEVKDAQRLCIKRAVQKIIHQSTLI